MEMKTSQAEGHAPWKAGVNTERLRATVDSEVPSAWAPWAGPSH